MRFIAIENGQVGSWGNWSLNRWDDGSLADWILHAEKMKMIGNLDALSPNAALSQFLGLTVTKFPIVLS